MIKKSESVLHTNERVNIKFEGVDFINPFSDKTKTTHIQFSLSKFNTSTCNWTKIHSTELLNFCSNPKFESGIIMDYSFEKRQILQIKSIHIDTSNSDTILSKAICIFELSSLVSSKDNLLKLGLIEEKNEEEEEIAGPVLGYAILKYEIIKNDNFQIDMVLQAKQLTSFGLFTKIKPILIISKPKLTSEQKEEFASKDIVYTPSMFSDWVHVYQSPKMSGNDVTFPVIHLDSFKLCGGNMNYPVRVSTHNIYTLFKGVFRSSCIITKTMAIINGKENL